MSKDESTGKDRARRFIEEARRGQAQREGTYRERALKLFPWVCAHCGREFSGKKLRELTVHHKDHNPDNNPPDGSNWELLCLYCHDYEHTKLTSAAGMANGETTRPDTKPTTTYQPFAGMADLLKGKPDPEGGDEQSG